jgi:hypothetical protein
VDSLHTLSVGAPAPIIPSRLGSPFVASASCATSHLINGKEGDRTDFASTADGAFSRFSRADAF